MRLTHMGFLMVFDMSALWDDPLLPHLEKKYISKLPNSSQIAQWQSAGLST